MVVNRIPRIILDGDKESSSYMAREGIRQLGILKALMGFSNLQQDIRKVEYIDGSRIVCRSCFGEDIVYIYTEKKEEAKAEERFYVYVTISDYVTIWDSSTGEIAKDICNNAGETYDEDGNSLITFPCHKDKLIKWLEGIKNKPTRQVLKDDPEDNRDYLANNNKDIGNENRLLVAMVEDPSYCCYFGLSEPIGFLNHVEYLEDRCEPYWCILPACQPIPDCTLNLNVCDLFIINTFDTVAETDNESYTYSNVRSHLYDYYIFYRLVQCRKYKDYLRSRNLISQPKYIQNYFDRSKHLYLCNYPGPCYKPDPFADLCIPYCTSEESSYEEPIDFESDHIYAYSTRDAMINPDLYINRFNKGVNAYTIRTALGDLIIDNTPKREYNESIERYYASIRDAAMAEGCYNIATPDNAYYASCDFEQATDAFGGHDISGDEPLHATATLSWYRNEDRQVVADILPGESTRTGVSWCGSLTPIDEFDEDGNMTKEAITKDWYRILLCFHMERQYTTWQEYYYDGSPVDLTEGEDYLARLSSVQATIELECPENYPKGKNILIPNNPDAIRYQRPEDYSSLCAFPDRDCGYPESEEGTICYPFDGTYDIYTLGEAVEELINGHYVDGSDDQLVVYLYKQDT